MVNVIEVVHNVAESYIAPYKAWYGLLKDLSIEHWMSMATFCFIFGIIIVNGNEASSNILVYGKNKPVNAKPYNSLDMLTKITNYFNQYNVPKAYFKHYYIFFTILLVLIKSILINLQVNAIPVINTIIISIYEKVCIHEPLYDINYSYLTIIFYLLLIQSFRRLYENCFITKFSKNEINILHYIFGLFFYLNLSLIIFIGLLPYYIQDYHIEIDITNLDPVDYATFIIFAFYSYDQYLNHIHLASLKKYSIPTANLFEWIGSAHYFDEIMIYCAIGRFFFGLQDNYWLKVNYGLIWLLVVLNLSISARESYKFYQAKFKEDFKVPYKLIPVIY